MLSWSVAERRKLAPGSGAKPHHEGFRVSSIAFASRCFRQHLCPTARDETPSIAGPAALKPSAAW
jgi:hypothetical protein